MDPISLLSKIQVVGGDVMELGIFLGCMVNFGTNKKYFFVSKMRQKHTELYDCLDISALPVVCAIIRH